MLTVIETQIFQRYAASVWNDDERIEFIDWIAANPEAGDVMVGTGGLRKVRFSRSGMGKRGGARVIYYNRLENGYVSLLLVYAKAKFDNLPADYLLRLKEQYDV